MSTIWPTVNWSVEFDGSRIKSPAEVTDIAKQLSLKGKSSVKSNRLKIWTYIIPHEFYGNPLSNMKNVIVEE